MKKLKKMRILFFLLIAIGSIHQIFCQNSESQFFKNEIKMNVFNFVTFQSADVEYEYLINENVSFGTDLYIRLYRVEEIKEISYFHLEVSNNRNFSLTPYFRRYFSKKYASGFFIEGFGMLSSGKTVAIEYVDSGPVTSQDFPEIMEIKSFDTYTDFAFGLSIGGKMNLGKTISIEFYTGIGLNMKVAFTQMVSRGGFSIGYRF